MRRKSNQVWKYHKVLVQRFGLVVMMSWGRYYAWLKLSSDKSFVGTAMDDYHKILYNLYLYNILN